MDWPEAITLYCMFICGAFTYWAWMRYGVKHRELDLKEKEFDLKDREFEATLDPARENKDA